MATAGRATVGIRSIETAVPDTVIRQPAFRDLLAGQPGLGRLGTRLVTAAFDASGIETRHSVVGEFDVEGRPEHPALFGISGGVIGTPTTKTRNDAYIAEAAPLAVEAGRRALAATGDLGPSDVTHVITVSCTGFSAPGPDYAIVRELGLAPGTQRLHVGFMGCYGAFPALRTAEQFCRADPSAVVLVVTVELCSLHLHVAADPDTIVAASVFADGAAAAIVTARPAPEGTPVLELDAFETMLVPEGEADMAWSIGDQGFDMVLSSYVPRIVEQNVRAALTPLLAHEPGLGIDDVDRWAIHPGGRSILDRVQSELGLSDEHLAPSRDVLRRYGNMSSATVLFVLRRLLHSQSAADGAVYVAERELVGAVAAGARTLLPEPPARRAAPLLPRDERIVAMAFGPGLTVETALLTRRVAAAPEPARSHHTTQSGTA